MQSVIGLGLVQPVLDVIARDVGCDVSRYMVWMHTGQSMQIDLHDPEWQGEITKAKIKALLKGVGAAVAALTQLEWDEYNDCPNQGCTLTVNLYATEKGFGVKVGGPR